MKGKFSLKVSKERVGTTISKQILHVFWGRTETDEKRVSIPLAFIVSQEVGKIPIEQDAELFLFRRIFYEMEELRHKYGDKEVDAVYVDQNKMIDPLNLEGIFFGYSRKELPYKMPNTEREIIDLAQKKEYDGSRLLFAYGGDIKFIGEKMVIPIGFRGIKEAIFIPELERKVLE